MLRINLHLTPSCYFSTDGRKRWVWTSAERAGEAVQPHHDQAVPKCRWGSRGHARRLPRGWCCSWRRRILRPHHRGGRLSRSLNRCAWACSLCSWNVRVIAVLCKYSKPLTSILCWLFWLFSSSFFFNFVLYARLKAVSALWLYWLTVSLGSEVPLSLVHICIPSVFLGWYMKLKLLFIAQRLAKLNQMKYFHDFRVIYLLPQSFSVKLSSTMECFLRHGFQPARLNLKLHQSRWLSRHACSFSRLPLCFCG